MTLYDEYKAVYENFQLLGNFLIKQLSKCEINETNDKSFDYLIEKVGDIRATPHINKYNAPPESKPDIVIDGSLSDFNISLAKRVRYYEELLAYYLVLKGVSRFEVNQCRTLAELINLIDKIEILKHSNLVLTSGTKDNDVYMLPDEYYGYSISIPYTLKDNDGNDITEGIIIAECNDIVYSVTTAGNPLSFTPDAISEDEPYHLKFSYKGTDKYDSCETLAEITIHPGTIEFDISTTNISNNSKYFGHNSIGSIGDLWEITIQTKCNNHMMNNIPFNIAIDEDYYEYTTDNNGQKTFTYTFNEKNNYTIACISTLDEATGMNNGTAQYNIDIKYNILQNKLETYTNYAGTTHTYIAEIHNEDTNEIDNTYDGQTILCIDGTDSNILIITNGQATYQKTSLSVNEFQLKWIFNQSNFSLAIKTNVEILSNFTLPHEVLFFLNNTPQIEYHPLGEITMNKRVHVTIEKLVHYTEATQLVIDGELQYETDTANEYVLDEDGQKIPIMITTAYDDYDESVYDCYTNASGILHNFNKLLSPGQYNITLTSDSDNLNETVYYNYELKEPFKIELVEYQKTSHVIYDVFIYDIDNADNIQYVVNGDDYDVITVSNTNNAQYVKQRIQINAVDSGTYTLTISLNQYDIEKDFTFFNHIFELQTPSVDFGESSIQILCHDESIDYIEIDGLDVQYIERNNNIFNVHIVSNETGPINFSVNSDNIKEFFTLTINKIDISQYINANIILNDEVVDTLSMTDINHAIVRIEKATSIDENLEITYGFKDDTSFYLDNVFQWNASLTSIDKPLPNGLHIGDFLINLTSAESNHYLPFTIDIPLTIIKGEPDIDIDETHTAFNDFNFFVYQPEFTKSNPAHVTSRGPNSYSTQIDGIWESIHCYLSDGWYNTGTWECDFDLTCGNSLNDSYTPKYMGIGLLISLSPIPPSQNECLIGGWEGPLASNPPGHYTRDNDSDLSIGTYTTIIKEWIHINMKKTSATTLTITKTSDNLYDESVTYEWQELSNYEKLTFGTWNNPAGNTVYGHLRIKNFIVRGVY